MFDWIFFPHEPYQCVFSRFILKIEEHSNNFPFMNQFDASLCFITNRLNVYMSRPPHLTRVVYLISSPSNTQKYTSMHSGWNPVPKISNLPIKLTSPKIVNFWARDLIFCVHGYLFELWKSNNSLNLLLH